MDTISDAERILRERQKHNLRIAQRLDNELRERGFPSFDGPREILGRMSFDELLPDERPNSPESGGIKTIIVNGIAVPEPMREAPELGTCYWFVDLYAELGVDRTSWNNTTRQQQRLWRGLCHLTESAARAHYEALIAPSRADAQPNSVEINGIKEPEWIEWNGGECPVSNGVDCEVRFRDGSTLREDVPKVLRWWHTRMASDIIAYRVWPAEPKQAEQDDDWCPHWEGNIGLHERECCSNCTRADCSHRNSAPTLAEPASTPPKVSSDELNREAVRALMRRVAALSYNDSYCGERPGAVKRAVMDWTRQQTRAAADYSKVDDKYQAAAIAREQAFHLAARQAARDAEQEKPASTAPDRQQQRFELTKAAMQGLLTHFGTDAPSAVATRSAEYADAALAELERTK